MRMLVTVMRPAVWQRLPDITPNYGQQFDRRAKMINGTRSREASVIVRDNVSTAHQLNIRLSTLTIERVRTIRLLNTNKQSFIARQSVKQRHLERAGITDVTLLPPQLMLLTTPSEAAEMASRAREAATQRRELIGATARTGSRLPTIASSTENQNTDSSIAEAAKNVATMAHVQREVDSSHRSAKFADTDRRLWTSGTGADASLTSSFMTHNFRRPRRDSETSDPAPPIGTSDLSQLPSSNRKPEAANSRNNGASGLSCQQDRRFLSLMSTLTARSPSGVDSYVQLSPSGSHVLGQYAKPPCDLERVRRAIDANQGTARLRYVRAMSVTAGGSRAARMRRSKTLGQLIDASKMTRSMTELIHSPTTMATTIELRRPDRLQ